MVDIGWERRRLRLSVTEPLGHFLNTALAETLHSNVDPVTYNCGDVSRFMTVQHRQPCAIIHP